LNETAPRHVCAFDVAGSSDVEAESTRSTIDSVVVDGVLVV
jgi:hypothetical protein